MNTLMRGLKTENHPKEMKKLKETLTVVLVLIVIVGFVYLGASLRRSIYPWVYQSVVQQDIQKAIKPLEERIAILESQSKTNR